MRSSARGINTHIHTRPRPLVVTCFPCQGFADTLVISPDEVVIGVLGDQWEVLGEEVGNI